MLAMLAVAVEQQLSACAAQELAIEVVHTEEHASLCRYMPCELTEWLACETV